MSDVKDPRVLFASERTLLAWNRTSISLMAFGFVIERFGLFLQLTGVEEMTIFQRHISFFVGESFVVLAVLIVFFSIWQQKRFIKSLRPQDIPTGYSIYAGIVVNAIVGILGIVLGAYLGIGFI
jgi:putative membrane protein